jgi:hypothetical protein
VIEMIGEDKINLNKNKDSTSEHNPFKDPQASSKLSSKIALDSLFGKF